MNGYDTNKQYVLIESPLSDEKYDIDFDIINERNEHIKQLAQDLEDIAETSLAITQLVNEQGGELELASDTIVVVEKDVEETTETLQQAESLGDKFRGWMKKGVIVSGGVTGAGALAGIFLNPIVGSIGIVAGLGGIVCCVLQMK